MYAVGTGGVSGRGLMQGFRSCFILPSRIIDFIYSVIAEEPGLSALSWCCCASRIAWRGCGRRHAPTRSARCWRSIDHDDRGPGAAGEYHAVPGLMPTKGIPLPVSAGGSSPLSICLVRLLNVAARIARA
jgi:cell division protein FtsW (lipid II flippase)